ncbi:hypothetical protein EVAR_55876_1 [Eumeta japonica]|uniref:Uncharacterized protein n=1 Tax=Eumeta variegata TaxID=151549 RepID=A0A4C1YLC0_EUMVA|nr:hypothetical protein EVAR_55876_1 [Eumeta japonica]
MKEARSLDIQREGIHFMQARAGPRSKDEAELYQLIAYVRIGGALHSEQGPYYVKVEIDCDSGIDLVLLRCTSTMSDFQGLMMEPEGKLTSNIISTIGQSLALRPSPGKQCRWSFRRCGTGEYGEGIKHVGGHRSAPRCE